MEARPGFALQGCPAAQLAAPLLSPVMWLLLPLPSTRFLPLQPAKTNSWAWKGILLSECCIRSELLGRRSESPRGYRAEKERNYGKNDIFFPLSVYISVVNWYLLYVHVVCNVRSCGEEANQKGTNPERGTSGSKCRRIANWEKNHRNVKGQKCKSITAKLKCQNRTNEAKNTRRAHTFMYFGNSASHLALTGKCKWIWI